MVDRLVRCGHGTLTRGGSGSATTRPRRWRAVSTGTVSDWVTCAIPRTGAPLDIVPLTLLRDGERTMAPDDDFLLREDDELLLAGRLRARAALRATTSDVSVASYVLDGRRVPSS